MEIEKRPAVLNGDSNPAPHNFGAIERGDDSFDAVLSSACDRLRDKHIQYSIRRIKEMEEDLDKLEKELDDILSAAGR